MSLLLLGCGSSALNPYAYPSPAFGFESDRLTGLSNNDAVTSFTDFIGGATCTSSGSPLYKTGGAGGYPYIDFVTASSQYFTIGSPVSLGTTGGSTIIAVSSNTPSGTTGTVVGQSAAGTFYIQHRSTTASRYRQGSNNNFDPDAAGFTTNLSNVYVDVFRRATTSCDVTMYRNGTSISKTLDNDSTTEYLISTIGSQESNTAFATMNLYALYIFQSWLSVGDSVRFSKALMGKYWL